MWAARGVKRGALARPRSVPETLPDAFAALAFMARQPEIDPDRRYFPLHTAFTK